ncbi:hypothetical protein LTR09_012531 [Extremus antarcticus]|uniref:SnoaL-like domain-containing protein n=1 Tax=Extremus antarcticus TaxID=702011 RepID=A0AAJ0D9R6_9PEZI|nr:hypothetical protein LTR09_012531 [Extremus antarcticus]
MATRNGLNSQTAKFFKALMELRSGSAPEELETFCTFFYDDAVANPISMREHKDAAKGREAIREAYKTLIGQQFIEERQVLSQTIDPDQKLVCCETRNRLNVAGKILDPFYETIVLRFNDDLQVTRLNVYSCRSPIVAILQVQSGKGPYANAQGEMEHLGL